MEHETDNAIHSLLTSNQLSLSIPHSSFNFPIHFKETINSHYIKATFMAFVDAVIPSTLGALDLRVDEYVEWTLERYASVQGVWGNQTISLTIETVKILDSAAIQLIKTKKVKDPLNFHTYPNGGIYCALSYADRFEAIRLLENLEVDLESLPPPFRNNSGLIRNIVTALHQMVIFGYYSEWFSLGSTRLSYPEDHCFNRQPFIWERLGYPGPSYGYKAVRGFLIDTFSE